MSGQRILLVLLLGVALAASAAGPGGAYPRPGHTEIVSVSSDGDSKTAAVASISATGRFVAFVSADSTIVIPDLNPGYDVFIHDRKMRRTELVSISSQGEQGIAVNDCVAIMPAVSADGRYVAFLSNASNLVPDDQNDVADVFVHDRRTKATELVSVSSKGRQQNEDYCEGGETEPDISISNNGRYVAFVSPASNLVDGDTNGTGDVFVHDRRSGRTERVSIASDGSQASGLSSCAVLNASGRYVAFTSSAPDLVSDDTNSASDAFVHDRKTGRTEMVSVASDGSRSREGFGSASECQGSFGSQHLSLSANARYVAFSGAGDHLVPADSPPLGGIADADVFVHDRKTGRTERVSVTNVGEESTGGFSVATAMSADGRFVAFASSAKNLYPNDNEEAIPIAFGDVDVFLHDRMTEDTRLISVSPGGEDGTCRPETPLVEDPFGGFSVHGYADLPSISADGRHISFVSCDTNLVTDERGPLPELGLTSHIFARDVGPELGFGKLSGSPPGSNKPPGNQICIAPGVCTPPQTTVAASDASNDVDETLTHQGANLYGASLAYRPQYEDLFAVIELEHMPPVLPGISPIFYGLRFEVQGKSYEVRATSLLGGTFGLFDCTGSPACNKLADLSGGYGTTGMRVVFSLPLDEIGLERGGELTDVVAFSGLGSYLSGASKILDRIVLE